MNIYLWLLSIGHLIVDLGPGVLPVLTPLLAENFNLKYFQIGLIPLAFTFSSSIIQPIFGILSDRYRMLWLMPLGLFLSGLGLALTGIIQSYTFLLFMILLSGIGVAGYHTEGSKLAYFASEKGKAGTSMAVFSVGGNLGFGLGPLLGMFVLSFNGLKSAHGLIIPGVLGALAFIYFLPKMKKIQENHSLNRKNSTAPSVVTDNRLGSFIFLMIYVIIRSWIHSGLIYFIPFYFPNYQGIAKPEYLISIFLLAGVLGTVLGGPFADRFGGRKGLLVSMAISLITIYPFLHLSGAWLPVLAFIVGASLISTFSTTVVFGQSLFPNNIGLASGLILGFGVGMGSLGVILLGAIADHMGLPFVMNMISLLPLLGIVLAFTLPDVRSSSAATIVKKTLQQQA